MFPKGVALVVGGSGGVGNAICLALAEAGSNVALTYHTNQDAALALVDELRAMGVKADCFQYDARDSTAAEKLFNHLADQYQNLHTLVNAAGANIPMRFINEITPQQWAEVIESDLNGFFNTISAALPHLRQGGGSIVQLSSIGLQRWPKRDVLSVAPKAGIEALLTGIASEEGRYGIRANSVQLGVIDAGIFHRLKESGDFDDRWLEAAINNTALKRFGTADDVANTVVFLASDKAAYITGQSIKMDGGYSL